jgi:hypothetical protein
MYRIGTNIYENRIVRQVGYLQELNRDARSTEHKPLQGVHSVCTYTLNVPPCLNTTFSVYIHPECCVQTE